MGDVVVVVDEGDEVEPGAARPEGGGEGLGHRRVARLLLAVDVQIARVPARRRVDGRRRRARGPVGIVAPDRVGALQDLDVVVDPVAVGRVDVGDAELDAPGAGLNRPRLVGAGREPIDERLAAGVVGRLVGEAVLGDREVLDGAAAPAAPVRLLEDR